MSSPPSARLRVGILGATGAVGQRFVSLLGGHPLFSVEWLGASPRSAGLAYGAACRWSVSSDVPAWAAAMTVVACAPSAMPGADVVFSALDADVAGSAEAAFRDAGVAVFSNARNYRMVADVPLVVPPVNGGHLQLVRAQASWAATGGFIVTNANCSTTGLVIVRRRRRRRARADRPPPMLAARAIHRCCRPLTRRDRFAPPAAGAQAAARRLWH